MPRAREAPTAGESAKCARRSPGEDASTEGVPEEVAVKRRRRQKHVGTTLRRTKESREESPTDRARRNTRPSARPRDGYIREQRPDAAHETCLVRPAQARKGATEFDRATGTSVPGISARFRTEVQSEGVRRLHEDHGKGRKAPQQQAPTDTRPWQRRHGSLRAREGSGVRAAREDTGRRGREASKHSAEVDASKERQTDLTESEALTGALG